MGLRASMIAALVLLSGTLLLLGSRVPDGAPNAAIASLLSLLTDGWAPLLWMISAAGLGSLAHSGNRVVRLGAGVATMLALDQVAGSLGLLATATGAWMLLVPGVLLAAMQWRRDRHRSGRTPPSPAPPRDEWLRWWWPLAPAAATLLFAATSSPGLLWSSEFGGYDALSYHLSLPRSWTECGALVPLAWNAYSFLPSWVEGAYLHCFALGGDPTLMGIRAQLLHAAITLAALALAGEAASLAIAAAVDPPSELQRCNDTLAVSRRVLAVAMLIGAPWIVVTGSLAYSESGVILGVAGVMTVWFMPSSAALRRGALIGLFTACMLGSKLSSGVTALPALGLLLLTAPRRGEAAASAPAGPVHGSGLPAGAAAALVVTLACLAPWLVRNASATGNPLFPFATGVFGAHDWSAEQVEIWNDAHSARGDLSTRLGALWRQGFIFGLGPSPEPGEPWRPFMGILPWLALVGAATSMALGTGRRLAVALLIALAIGAAGWMLFTHMKSRFLIGLLPLASIAAVLGVEAILRRAFDAPRVRRRLVIAASLLLSLAPAAAFLSEGPLPAAMIGAERVMTGDTLAELLANPATRRLAEEVNRSRAFVLNHEIAPEAQARGRVVLLIGDAATFRIRAPFRASTVWTRDPLVARWLDDAQATAQRQVHDPDPPPPRGSSDGEAVRRMLDEAGVGWVLIDPTMLEVWARSGWLDRGLTPERLTRAIEPLEPLRRFEDGALLLRVGADTVMRPPSAPLPAHPPP